MVNLRYHIVSLVAVFLALAIGVIAGTTAIDQGVVNVLRAQSDSFRSARDAARADNASLREQLDTWEGYAASILMPQVEGSLDGATLVILSTADVPAAALDELANVAVTAGATIAGRVTFTDRWALSGDEDREALADLLGADGLDRDALLAMAADSFARRMGTSRRGPGILGRWAEAGWLALDRPSDRDFPPRASIIVYLSGPGDRPSAGAFGLPVVRALSERRDIVVGSLVGQAGPLTAAVRGDADLRALVGTVDHADTTVGRIALIDVTSQVLAGGAAPHYGVGPGASAIAPVP